MTVYYNENDPKAAAWLRELMFEDHIPWGDVDERSIEDVTPRELAGYTQCHFFAGIGGWAYALRLAGWPEDRPVWTGSCPCQPFSAAGKGVGFADERHLWPAWHWLIEQQKPIIVFGEQVASADGLMWFDLVSTDFENSDYTCAAVDTCAAGVGAPHIRQRLYWVAHRHSAGWPHAEGGSRPTRENRRQELVAHSGVGNPDCDGYAPGCEAPAPDRHWSAAVTASIDCLDGRRRPIESGLRTLAYGLPPKLGFICKGFGNAIVPDQAAQFIKAVM